MSMCFEIQLNGEPTIAAGRPALDVLTAIVTLFVPGTSSSSGLAACKGTRTAAASTSSGWCARLRRAMKSGFVSSRSSRRRSRSR